MTLYQWDKTLESGHAMIDKQHRQLLAALNDMWSAYHEGNGQEWLERSVDFLAGYSVKHFADEEKLQIEYAYPDYIRHKQLHEEFKLTTRSLQERLIREGATDALVDEVCACLGDWFVSHIQGEDFALAAHIKSKDGENMNCQESP